MVIMTLQVPWEKRTCPWKFIGEDTGGDIFWCEDCGTLFTGGDDGDAIEQPSRVDFNSWLCKDQGYIV